MSKHIFFISLLFLSINTLSAEELSNVDVTSSVFSNSINESK